MSKKIDRKEAIKKMGKYAAMTAGGTFLILNPKSAQAASCSTGRPCGTAKGGGAFDF